MAAKTTDVHYLSVSFKLFFIITVLFRVLQRNRNQRETERVREEREEREIDRLIDFKGLGHTTMEPPSPKSSG